MRAYELDEDFNIRVPTISLRHVNRLKHEKRKSDARRRARQPVINAMYGISSAVNKAKKSKKKKIELARGPDGLLSARPPSAKKAPNHIPPTSSQSDRQDAATTRKTDPTTPDHTVGSNGADENQPRFGIRRPEPDHRHIIN